MRKDPTKRWSLEDALETWGIRYWGQGYFGVNERGHLTVLPGKDAAQAIDLKDLVDDLRVRDIRPPILLRFSDILRDRIRALAEAFRTAIAENHYRGGYFCVYPVKVNQQRQVVEEICEFGAEFGFGLEAGSKPELIAVLPLAAEHGLPVVCNGFKDDEYIEMTVLAQKMGHQVIPVVEKYSEILQIVRYSEVHGVRPDLGIRVKLAARGAGKWELSGGMRSKFGLFVSEVRRALRFLKERGMEDSLKLLHFHLGSQITNIRSIKQAVTELARMYVQLRKAGAGITYLDVGGGLGVDYDGSRTNWESSMNYTLEEYASDVVYRIMSACDEEQVEHPTIISESGRALVAYHSVLVFDILGVSHFDEFPAPDPLPEDNGAEEIPQPLYDLFEANRDITRKNCIEYFHDGLQAYDEALHLFNLGYLDLEQRCVAERFFWALLQKVARFTHSMDPVPEELEGLPDFLADTYFCNFSIFQSLPDAWAVNHHFPIAPIHRLGERPARRGVLADITCDSDGKIDGFTDLRDDKRTLELHPFDGRPYYLGAFLIGAYQEILGDLHNLLGDTHAVHVQLDADGTAEIRHVVHGDTVEEVLGYVQYSGADLLNRLRREAERAVKRGRLTLEESTRLLRFYRSGLQRYTYLE